MSYARLVLAYVNGVVCSPGEARVSPFDRGFVFADGIYEVMRVTRLGAGGGVGGGGWRLVSPRRHERRMTRSLCELGIAWDVRDSSRGLVAIARRLAEAAGLHEALVYVQVTRGVPDLSVPPLRSHVPVGAIEPTVFAFIRALPELRADAVPPTKVCVTQADVRWRRCDIKSVSLLGNVMASMAAREAGGEEAILLSETIVDEREADGRVLPRRVRVVSEGSLTNVAVVTRGGELVTPSRESVSLLPGITREVLLERDPGGACGRLREGVVTERDLREAREVMLLGTTASVTAVTSIDGVKVGDGGIGPEARRLQGVLLGMLATGTEDIDGAVVK